MKLLEQLKITIFWSVEPCSLVGNELRLRFVFSSIIMTWYLSTPPPKKKEYDYVGFEVLISVSPKMANFWIVAPCRLEQVYKRFRGFSCFHYQGEAARTPETLVRFY